MPVAPDLDLVLPDDLGRVHLIGVGGSGMNGIAHMLLDAGVPISGSDRDEGPYLDALRDRGVRIAVGHDAANLGDADTIVFSSAIRPDNPEYLLARERGLHLLHRSQALHWLSRGRRVVAVAGAHGKTTTTGMIATILRGMGVDAGFVSGGLIQGLHASAASGAAPEFVLEADESDGSFLLYDTAAAVITNVETVHRDRYGSDAVYEDAFARFAGRAREVAVIGEGAQADRVAAAVAAQPDGPRVVRVGEGPDADWRVTGIATGASVTFDLTHDGATVPVRVAMPGRHTAWNAAAALAAVAELGHPLDRAVAALEAFRGTKRRFELKGEVRGVAVYDEYAHEPAEAAVAVAGARTVVGDGRVIAIHQPHLYSRTRDVSDRFARAYEEAADFTVVLAVDGAREDPIPGVSGQLVVDAFRDKSRVRLIEDWQEAADFTASIAREGDLVMTLSCGSVYRMIPQLLEALERVPAASGEPVAGASPADSAGRR